MSGAALHLLKRYYLGTPEGIAGEPGLADPLAALPEWPAERAYLAQQLLVGAPRTAIYGLLAAAYALVYGLVARVNLAFGEIAAVGAASAGLVAAGIAAGGLTSALPGLAAGMAAAIFAASLHGAVTGRVAFATVPADRAQASLIATIGISLFLMEYLRLAGGAVPDWIPPYGSDPVPVARAGAFVVTLTPVSLLTTAFGIGAALALVALMRLTAFGRAWRASSDDPLAASLFGVDGTRLLTTTLALAGAAAGLAGALVAIQFGALGFAGGFTLGLKALAASILGGIGSVVGALIGGVAIALFETLWSAYLPIEGRDLALYAVLVTTIVIRPNGLFGVAGPRQAVP